MEDCGLFGITEYILRLIDTLNITQLHVSKEAYYCILYKLWYWTFLFKNCLKSRITNSNKWFYLKRAVRGLPTVYEEQLETKFSRETENVFTLSLSITMLTTLVLPLLHFCERDSGSLFNWGVTTNFIFILIPYYPYLHGRIAMWRKWRAYDVG